MLKPSLKPPHSRRALEESYWKLHDTVQQHLRALKSMGYEPSGPFITSTLELKLEQSTMFEWQKHSQKSPGVPHYQDLDFLNLHAQASESSHSSRKPKYDTPNVKKVSTKSGLVASFATNSDPSPSQCFLCKPEKHPLYACPRFRNMTHKERVSTLKSNRICMNCLSPNHSNHFMKRYKSLHRCKRCQKPHHTLLHVESTPSVSSTPLTVTPQSDIISSNTAISLKSNWLLVTCRVLVSTPDGTSVEAQALLDASASFTSECLAQSFCLPHANQNARISGIAGLSLKSPLQSLATFSISPVKPSTRKVNITAVVVP